MPLTSARYISPVSDERRKSPDNQRTLALHSLVRSLQIQPLSQNDVFALHIPVSGFSGDFGPGAGAVAHYGGGVQGWGKRFGATLADTESRRFIQTFALSTILHQDPRYFPSHKRTLISRAWYATTRVVVTKNDKGENTFNTSEFLGTLFTSALQNAYYPREDRTLGDTMNRYGGALSSDAVGNLLREFTPDMKRLFRKHAPEKIKKIEEKLPIPPEDKP